MSARDSVSLRFVGMLVDLPGVNLSLKMIELFDGQAVEQLNAALDLKGRLQKMLVLLFVRAFERHGIIDAPVGAHRGARKSRAALAGIIGERDNKVKLLVGEFLPGVCHRAGGIYFEVFAENLQARGWISPVGISPAL